MQEITRKVAGPYFVEEDTILSGTVTGDLVAEGGNYLELRGIVTGSAVAKLGSCMDIYGMVIGTVVNEGAEVTIYGTVGGVIDVDDGATTRILPGAVVRS